MVSVSINYNTVNTKNNRIVNNQNKILKIMSANETIIKQALKGARTKDKLELCGFWFEFLSEKLVFPFSAKAVIAEYTQNVKDGDIVTVKSIYDYYDMYGIMMEVSKERKKYYIPLCELEVAEKKSGNFKYVEAYNDWFANYDF